MNTLIASLSGKVISRRTAFLLLVLMSSLVGCGGGGGGGSSPVSGELPVVLGLAGPGDPENYLPLAVGNFWHFRGTTSGASSGTWENSVSVTGTRLVNAATATMVYESNASGGGTSDEQGYVKDPNGIAVLNAEDAFEASLTPRWELRFPLQTGSEFVQLDRKNLDLLEDLDGDGINERVDVRSDVRVVGFEAVNVPVGSFSNAARIERQMALRVYLSKSGQVVDGTEVGTAWFARNVGWVRRTSTVTVLGQVTVMDEVLDAYYVDGVAGGMQVASNAVAHGTVDAGGRAFWVFPISSAGRQTAALTGLTGNADLAVLTIRQCASSFVGAAGLSPEDCSFYPLGGSIVVAVSGIETSRYLLSLAASPSVASPTSESKLIPDGTPTTGQVAPRGESTYSVDGLTPGNYTISIAGLSADADLKVYFDETYSMEQDCTLRGVGDVTAKPEDCTTASSGRLFFRVRSGELNLDGASYLILVHSAP